MSIYSSLMIKLTARQILDSRGNPTIEAILQTEKGQFTAAAPSGSSTGKYEALELRDGESAFKGKGISRALRNIEEIIAPAIRDADVENQAAIDQIFIYLDATPNKSKLGANAILPVSIAVARAGARAKNLPLYQYLAELSGSKMSLPLPAFNILNGGAHAKNNLDIQEFMVVPHKSTFKDNLELARKVFDNLGKKIREVLGEESLKLADEGGYDPLISKTREALNLIMEAIKETDSPEIKIALDVASSELYREGMYELEGKSFNREELADFYLALAKDYPILSIEDPFAEDDWNGWEKFSLKARQENPQLILMGDDLTVTNSGRIKDAIAKKCIGGVIIKPNQIGTVSETLESIRIIKKEGLKIMVSHRSGETLDTFIADLAVGTGADFIKSGAPSAKERMVKYSRLLQIEEEIYE